MIVGLASPLFSCFWNIALSNFFVWIAAEIAIGSDTPGLDSSVYVLTGAEHVDLTCNCPDVPANVTWWSPAGDAIATAMTQDFKYSSSLHGNILEPTEDDVLRVHDVTRNDGGLYACSCANNASAVRSVVRLHVLDRPPAPCQCHFLITETAGAIDVLCTSQRVDPTEVTFILKVSLGENPKVGKVKGQSEFQGILARSGEPRFRLDIRELNKKTSGNNNGVLPLVVCARHVLMTSAVSCGETLYYSPQARSQEKTDPSLDLEMKIILPSSVSLVLVVAAVVAVVYWTRRLRPGSQGQGQARNTGAAMVQQNNQSNLPGAYFRSDPYGNTGTGAFSPSVSGISHVVLWSDHSSPSGQDSQGRDVLTDQGIEQHRVFGSNQNRKTLSVNQTGETGVDKYRYHDYDNLGYSEDDTEYRVAKDLSNLAGNWSNHVDEICSIMPCDRGFSTCSKTLEPTSPYARVQVESGSASEVRTGQNSEVEEYAGCIGQNTGHDSACATSDWSEARVDIEKNHATSDVILENFLGDKSSRQLDRFDYCNLAKGTNSNFQENDPSRRIDSLHETRCFLERPESSNINEIVPVSTRDLLTKTYVNISPRTLKAFPRGTCNSETQFSNRLGFRDNISSVSASVTNDARSMLKIGMTPPDTDTGSCNDKSHYYKILLPRSCVGNQPPKQVAEDTGRKNADKKNSRICNSSYWMNPTHRRRNWEFPVMENHGKLYLDFELTQFSFDVNSATQSGQHDESRSCPDLTEERCLSVVVPDLDLPPKLPKKTQCRNSLLRSASPRCDRFNSEAHSDYHILKGDSSVRQRQSSS